MTQKRPARKPSRRQPLAAVKKLRARPAEAQGWTERLRAIRSCCHCKTVYRDAGAAYRCEHWHEGTEK